MSVYDDMIKKRGSLYDKLWSETIGGSAPSPSSLGQREANDKFLSAVHKRQDAYDERQFEKWLKERDEQIKKEQEKKREEEEKRRREEAKRKKDREELSIFEALGEGFKGFGTGVKNIFDGDPDTTFFGGGAEKMIENTEGMRQSKGLNELNRAATRVANSSTLGTLNEAYDRTRGERHSDFTSEGRSGVGKAADIGYDILGSLIPGTGAAKVSRGLIKAPTTWKGKALEGAGLGAAYTGAEVGIREALNGEDYSAKDNMIDLALNTVAGAVVDPIADALIGKITRRLAKGDDPVRVAREEGVSTQSVEKVQQKIVRGTLEGQEVVGARSGKELPPPVNVMRDPLGLGGRTADNPSLPRMGLPEPTLYRNRFKGSDEVQINGTPGLPGKVEKPQNPLDFMLPAPGKTPESKTSGLEPSMDSFKGEVPEVEDVSNVLGDSYSGKYKSKVEKVQEDWLKKLVTKGTVFSHKGKDFEVSDVKGNSVTLTDGKRIPLNSLRLLQDGSLAYTPQTAPIPKTEDPFQLLKGVPEPKFSQPVNATEGPDLEGLEDFVGRDLSDPEVMGEVLDRINDLDSQMNDISLKYEDELGLDPKYNEILDENNRTAQIEQEWRSVKALQEDAKRMQDKVGKVYIPEENRADWWDQVPPRFRAAKNAKQAGDIYKAADDTGYSSVDEFIADLQKFDQALKTKKKDLGTMDRPNSEVFRELKDMEHAARGKARTDEGYLKLNALATKLMDLVANPTQKLEMPQQVQEDPLNFVTQLLKSNRAGQDLDPLRFAKEIGSRRDPLSFTARNDNPKADRFEGEFSTRQVDTPSGDTLRMDVKPKQSETPLDDLIFKTQQEQRPFKTQMEKEFARQDIQEVDGRNRASQGDSDAIKSEPTDKLFRVNLQAFDGKKEKMSDSLVSKTDPKESKDAIDLINNKIKRMAHKGYEQIVNKRHSLHIADKLRTENALDVAIKNGNKKAAKQLSDRLAQIKKKGSQIEKAATNEETANVMTSSMLERGFKPIQDVWKSAGISTKEGIHYQLAKNIRYILDNVNPKYQLPKGWDAGRINQIINTAEFGSKKEAFKQQTKHFQEMMGDVRQYMLDYDLKPKEEIDLLAENPYYIPMFRDRDWMADNVARATAGRKSSTANSVLDLYGLEGGDMQNYLKNPLESIAELTHMVVRKGLQNDTALELKKLADIEESAIKSLGDKAGDNYDNILVRRVRNGETPDIVGIENGERFGLKLQGDLQEVINEGRDVKLPSGFTAKLTRGYADLKTSSLAHQIVAAPRDMIQGYFNSQIRDPFRYMTELARVIKDGNMDAKRMGAHFERGYNSQTGGEKDHQKMIQDFAKQNKGVTIADPKSWLKLPKNILLGPGRFLGEVSDQTMRSIEVRETERKFAPLIKDAEKRLAEARKGGDFSEQTRGIAEIQQELKDLRKQARRESTYEGRDMMNYSRTGRAGWVQNVIKPYMVFANTTTQSKDRFFRQLKRDPFGTVGKVAVPVAGMFAFQQMSYNNASEEDKEVMDLAPDYVKDYFYMLPDGSGKVWMVPKPHEAIPIIKGIEAAGEKYFNTRENVVGDPMNEWYRQLIQEYIPLQLGNLLKGSTPDRYGKIDPLGDATLPGTVASPIIDAVANNKLSFNRKPISYDNPYPQKGEDGYNPNESSLIIPEGDTQDEYSQPWTPGYAKALGGDTVNADFIDNFLKDILGDYSAPARTTADGVTTGSNPLAQLLQDLTIRKVRKEGYTDREKEKLLFPERFEN
jgi:hypothetical protein